MYYSYIEIEYVAMSISPARTDLALKLLRINTKPSLSAPGQPLWKRLPALDRADPLIPCHRRSKGLRHGGDVCGLLCWRWTVFSTLFLS
jgi:hypothetical protein